MTENKTFEDWHVIYGYVPEGSKLAAGALEKMAKLYREQ